MLILLRTSPDDRLREVIASIPPDEDPAILVYLEGALDSPCPPLIFPKNTYALDPETPAGITSITQEDLLRMIHKHPKTLVLP